MLRATFNYLRLFERASTGQLGPGRFYKGRRPHTLQEGNEDFPPGTRRVMWEVLDAEARRIALAFVYMLPDGTIGGTGKLPDPKQILHVNERWIPADHRCNICVDAGSREANGLGPLRELMAV